MNNWQTNSGYATGQPYYDPAQGNIIVGRPKPSAGFVLSFLCIPFIILGIMFGFTYLITSLEGANSTCAVSLASGAYLIVFVIVFVLFVALLLVGFPHQIYVRWAGAAPLFRLKDLHHTTESNRIWRESQSEQALDRLGPRGSRIVQSLDQWPPPDRQWSKPVPVLPLYHSN